MNKYKVGQKVVVINESPPRQFETGHDIVGEITSMKSVATKDLSIRQVLNVSILYPKKFAGINLSLGHDDIHKLSKGANL